jgi:hypothetical protein
MKKSRKAADELAELLLRRFVDPRRGAVHCGIIYCLSRCVGGGCVGGWVNMGGGALGVLLFVQQLSGCSITQRWRERHLSPRCCLQERGGGPGGPAEQRAPAQRTPAVLQVRGALCCG